MEIIKAVVLTGTIIICILIAMLSLLIIVLRRAAGKVIDLFREHGALGPGSAKTREELGLREKEFLERMVKPKDYKLHALYFLINLEIIKITSDNRLFLSEDCLASMVRKKSQDEKKLGNIKMWKLILPLKI